MKALLPPVLLLAAFLSGCVSEPDPAYDLVAVNTLVLNDRTKAAVADGNAGRLSLAESRRFLRQSRAQARGVRARADQCHLSRDELKILDWLDGEYATLLRRPRPLRSASALRLQNSLAALQDLRPVRMYWIQVKGTPDTSNNDTDTSDTDNNRHHDHDGHDHGGHDGHDHGDSGGGHGHK
ncbi:hypothetical protein CfE428DRAFT_3814 [Chthoniobacter flavus Ellin428]|uniref:Lipoprotein n=1 Tax=Chthoniobacter flavus Ellin428 TaxID=497964 RepID=B4D4H6_9BACT|nr:hypothetical protein [Chthoniobacter flavus]EDY18777.1 hypothetical protein CfE428DRAFT_3814 [Chthoniobacter flavus Ellin428]TCO88988.1 hypothetical protein EV701_1159 [Chthoniobacter flavus]